MHDHRSILGLFEVLHVQQTSNLACYIPYLEFLKTWGRLRSFLPGHLRLFDSTLAHLSCKFQTVSMQTSNPAALDNRRSLHKPFLLQDTSKHKPITNRSQTNQTRINKAKSLEIRLSYRSCHKCAPTRRVQALAILRRDKSDYTYVHNFHFLPEPLAHQRIHGSFEPRK